MAVWSQISEFLPQLAVTWLWSSWNVDITRSHWVLSLHCLWLEACDCDCRWAATSCARWWWWPCGAFLL